MVRVAPEGSIWLFLLFSLMFYLMKMRFRISPDLIKLTDCSCSHSVDTIRMNSNLSYLSPFLFLIFLDIPWMSSLCSTVKRCCVSHFLRVLKSC
ncbi:hypothetical protein BJY00DRAFT_91365 [Aspergillus carlsbadensis]|nr:hypothetical protein BJY00DRAFT_91365 [Aspergillus carlsbadensis]